MNFPLIANIVVFVVLLFALAQTRHKQWSLAKKVLVGLVMGVVFGLALHTIYGSDSQVLKDSVQWFNIVGNGYVQLLLLLFHSSQVVMVISGSLPVALWVSPETSSLISSSLWVLISPKVLVPSSWIFPSSSVIVSKKPSRVR